MDKQEFIEALTNIGTCEDDVERRTLLADLQEKAGADYDTLQTLTNSNNQLTKDNENLRSANMKLFTRLGKGESDDIADPNGTGIKDKPETKLKFEDLFNEKGEIK
jgi:hypothetical protein